MKTPLSILESFKNKNIVLSGSSGFLGKVWLVLILDRIPQVGKIFLLLRRKGSISAVERFEQIATNSFAFKPLHDRYGDKLNEFLSQHVEVLEGDISEPNLGLSDSDYMGLQEKADLFVNCAGLVEFNPDVRDALATNVRGALNALEFVKGSRSASLLHVSTNFVVGNRQGLIEEAVLLDEAPKGEPFDVEHELEDLEWTIKETLEKQNSVASQEEIRREIVERYCQKNKVEPTKTRLNNLAFIYNRKKIREIFSKEGEKRAKRWGWPNTYTYSKALAEMALMKRKNTSRVAIFRPAIVESALEYPFPGWNEGFNTSGPLAYLLATWFRYLPAKKGNPFDVIPVDLCCNGLTITAANLLNGQAKDVYQCGSSDRNCLTIGRACELTSLGHRIRYRKEGKNILERLILSRWDAIAAHRRHPITFRHLKPIIASADIVSKMELLERFPGISTQLLKFSEKLVEKQLACKF